MVKKIFYPKNVKGGEQVRTGKIVLVCLIFCVSMALLTIDFALAQPTEANVDVAGSHNIIPTDGDEGTDPQGIPIDCPGGPT
ncbi:hypothetical protein DRO34_06630 [Candidatus Bathyarchaeota archaeon]|nr:MAG: hypothetical protein DRO34_06630 [Candidatus Bathyarchaeota archaeon]